MVFNFGLQLHLNSLEDLDLWSTHPLSFHSLCLLLKDTRLNSKAMTLRVRAEEKAREDRGFTVSILRIG